MPVVYHRKGGTSIFDSCEALRGDGGNVELTRFTYPLVCFPLALILAFALVKVPPRGPFPSKTIILSRRRRIWETLLLHFVQRQRDKGKLHSELEHMGAEVTSTPRNKLLYLAPCGAFALTGLRQLQWPRQGQSRAS